MTSPSTQEGLRPGGSAPADPRAYLRTFWRWSFLFIAAVVIIPVSTYLYESGRPKVYQSSALLEITGGQQLGVASLLNQAPSGPDTTDLLADARLIDTSGVADQAVKYLPHPPAKPRSLLGSVSASADQTTGFLTITAKAASPDRAAAIANAFGQAIVQN